MELVCIEIRLCEGLWCHLPLSHLFIRVLIVRCGGFASVINLLLEPSHVVGLLHDNLDSGTSHMQLVVNSVEKLGLSVNAHLLAALPRYGGWICAQLLLESILAAHATTASQRLLEALVGFNQIMVLLIILPLLLFGDPRFSLLLLLTLFENFVDNFAAFEQVLNVFFGLFAHFFSIGFSACRGRSAFAICLTTTLR